MILYRNCPICNSNQLVGFAMDLKRSGPHISRVKCKGCKVSFANPMADQKELVDYYTSYYEKDHYDSMAYKQLILKEFQKIRSQSKSEILKNARYLNKLGNKGGGIS